MINHNNILGKKIEWRNSFRIHKGIVVDSLANDNITVLESTDCDLYNLNIRNDNIIILKQCYKEYINYLIIDSKDFSYDYKLKNILDCVEALDADSKTKKDLNEYVHIMLSSDLLNENSSESESDDDDDDDESDSDDNSEDTDDSSYSSNDKVNVKVVISKRSSIRGFNIKPSNGLNVIKKQLFEDYNDNYDLYHVDNDGDRIHIKAKNDLLYCIENNKSKNVLKLIAEPKLEESSDSISKSLDTSIVWQKGELIGSGSFGNVYKGLELSTGNYIAVKEVNISNRNKQIQQLIQSLQTEIKLLSVINHKNIIQYLGSEYLQNNIRIFLELATDGSIKDMLNEFGSLSEATIQKYTIDIIDGLEFLHSKKIVHRDIKPSNLLISHGVIKLADFGCATLINYLDEEAMLNSNLMTMAGTTIYMSPEVMQIDQVISRRSSKAVNSVVTTAATSPRKNSLSPKKGYGRKTDIWSLGMTLVEMAIGKLPYRNAATAIYNICILKEYPTFPKHFTDSAFLFLDRCLVEDSKSRASSSELKSHEFLTTIVKNVSTVGLNYILSSATKDYTKFQLVDNAYSTNGMDETLIQGGANSMTNSSVNKLFQSDSSKDYFSVKDMNESMKQSIDQSMYSSSIYNTAMQENGSYGSTYTGSYSYGSAETVTTQSGIVTSRSNFSTINENIVPVRKICFADDTYDSKDSVSEKSLKKSNSSSRLMKK